MKKSVRIGTRGSKLALWQAYYVAELLNKKGISSNIIPIQTKGDRIHKDSLIRENNIGIFTAEIEKSLKKGTIDIAVHSAKDLPATLPKGFHLVAFTEREQSHDVLVSFQKNNLLNSSLSIKVGTSSVRRLAMLKRFFPMCTPIEIRGNLQTRIRKMNQGHCHALLLAYAGIHRMKLEKYIIQQMSIETFTPMAGQGSIAIEVHEDMPIKDQILFKSILNNPIAMNQIVAERSYLRSLAGGCSIPVFVSAAIQKTTLVLTGGIISLDGKEYIKEKVTGQKEEAEIIGKRLGQLVLQKGGKNILSKIVY